MKKHRKGEGTDEEEIKVNSGGPGLRRDSERRSNHHLFVVGREKWRSGKGNLGSVE